MSNGQTDFIDRGDALLGGNHGVTFGIKGSGGFDIITGGWGG